VTDRSRVDQPPAFSPALGPPFALDLLADLHAGVPDDAAGHSLRHLMAADPAAAAAAVFRALEATVADLAALGTAPVGVSVPATVAARIDAALATLTPITSAGTTVGVPLPPAVPDLGAARRAMRARAGARRRGRAGSGRAGGGPLAWAAAVAAVVLVGGVVSGGVVSGVVGGRTDTVQGRAQAQPIDLGDGQLGTAVLASLGATDLGPLQDRAVLAGCLSANGVTAGTPLLGSAEVLLRGRPGVLLLLPSGTAGIITALVVGPTCSADDPALITQKAIGRR
jgi:hypothetical protein